MKNMETDEPIVELSKSFLESQKLDLERYKFKIKNTEEKLKKLIAKKEHTEDFIEGLTKLIKDW